MDLWESQAPRFVAAQLSGNTENDSALQISAGMLHENGKLLFSVTQENRTRSNGCNAGGDILLDVSKESFVVRAIQQWNR